MLYNISVLATVATYVFNYGNYEMFNIITSPTLIYDYYLLSLIHIASSKTYDKIIGTTESLELLHH